MAKLLVATNPIDGDIDKVLKIVGIDKKAKIAVIGSEVGRDICSKYLCLDPLKGFENIARDILNAVYSEGFSSTTLILNTADPETPKRE